MLMRCSECDREMRTDMKTTLCCGKPMRRIADPRARTTGYYVIALRLNGDYKVLLGPFDSGYDAIKAFPRVTVPPGATLRAIRRTIGDMK